MGFEAAGWLQDKTDLRGDEHVIAMLLALGADESNGLVYRKLQTLAKHGHMSEHEVIEILTALEAKGIIDLDTQKADAYAICIMSAFLEGREDYLKEVTGTKAVAGEEVKSWATAA